MNLSQWAESAICCEQDGTSVERVRLVLDDETMATWVARDWTPAKGGEYLSQLLEELPARSHEAVWLAETGEGVVRSQLPQSVVGRSRKALRNVETTAEAQARATARLLDATQGHLEQQAKSIALLLRQNQQLMEQVTTQQPSAKDALIGAVSEELVPIARELPGVMRAVAYYLGPKKEETSK